MPPLLALLLWIVLLVALFRLDPAKERKVSKALWVPFIWFFIVASKLPSQWIGGSYGYDAQASQEGNLTDSVIYSLLILISLGILLSRSFRWEKFLAQNLWLTLYLGFALLSLFWSDFPFVTFKRWFRDLGNYLVALVVLTDAYPLEAISTLLRRVSYVLISLSVVFVKYFPYLAIHYSPYSGAPEYVGATTSKNMLGVLCLMSGIFFAWDTMTRWRARKERKVSKLLLGVNLAYLAMTLWLLHLCASSTSRLCWLLASLVIALSYTKTAKRNPAFLKWTIPTGVCMYLFLAFGLGIDLNAMVAESVGKDPTLTGRTVIWNAVLSTHINPLLGAGYESFWMGKRLEHVWRLTGPGINEAHNGYLEVYLNLGIIGVLLMAGFLASSFRKICTRIEVDRTFGALSLGLWTIVPFYNVSEAALRGQLLFLVFLLAAVTVPSKAKAPARATDRPRQVALNNPTADLHPALPIPKG